MVEIFHLKKASFKKSLGLIGLIIKPLSETLEYRECIEMFMMTCAQVGFFSPEFHQSFCKESDWLSQIVKRVALLGGSAPSCSRAIFTQPCTIHSPFLFSSPPNNQKPHPEIVTEKVPMPSWRKGMDLKKTKINNITMGGLWEIKDCFRARHHWNSPSFWPLHLECLYQSEGEISIGFIIR